MVTVMNGPAMSTLRSVLHALCGEDLSVLSDSSLDDRLVELSRARRVLEAESARVVAEIERRGSYGSDGHLSVTSFVGSRLQVGFCEASREVKLSQALEAMPSVRAAFREGEVSSSAVAVLERARESSPEAFSASEDVLVDAARSLPHRELRSAVAAWTERVAPTAARDAEDLRFARRGLHVTRRSDRMVRLGGELDPETGTTVATAMGAVIDAWARSVRNEDRTPAQIRADALGEICRGWLDRPDRPEVGTERPHLTVVVDLDALEGRRDFRTPHDVGQSEPHPHDPAGAPHHRTSGGPDAVAAHRLTSSRRDTSVGTTLPVEAVRRLACDAVVSRVITSGRSEPLEAGRSTRVVPPSMRRALVVRDSGCAFPDCDRPPSWCDAHHVRHWADGGSTDMSNLVLLCRRHHRLIHAGFGVEMVEGRTPVFRRPDGTVIGGPPGVAGTAVAARAVVGSFGGAGDRALVGAGDRAPP